MEYTSRVQRRQQQKQQPVTEDGLQSVESLIDVETTKEMPITMQIPVQHLGGNTRQTARQQKQIDQLVEELHPLTQETPAADTNLEILKRINIVTPPSELESDVEYGAAQTKFAEATQQLHSLMGDLQRTKRRKQTQSVTIEPEQPRTMFDLELAHTQELTGLPQLHSQVASETVATNELTQVLASVEVSPIPLPEPITEENPENAEKATEATKELTFNYKKTDEVVEPEVESVKIVDEVGAQIAKDRLINKILIATLIILSVAVIITLGIGLSIIFLDQSNGIISANSHLLMTIANG